LLELPGTKVVKCLALLTTVNNSGEPPSNVTRIARIMRRTCHDGTHQVIVYHSGVGSNGTTLDHFTGGVFGMGLAQVSIFRWVDRKRAAEQIALSGS
jgi:uncharacterized protein (DUF2235 family)